MTIMYSNREAYVDLVDKLRGYELTTEEADMYRSNMKDWFPIRYEVDRIDDLITSRIRKEDVK